MHICICRQPNESYSDSAAAIELLSEVCNQIYKQKLLAGYHKCASMKVWLSRSTEHLVWLKLVLDVGHRGSYKGGGDYHDKDCCM